MANVTENDQLVIGECEATVVITPKDFFGNENFEQGDWAQTKERPTHIGGTADWAVYPTRHFRPTLNNLTRMLEVASHCGITLGRNEEQVNYLQQFIEGKLAIADIGDFDASTKPVPVSVLPYWWFVRSEKDKLGKNITVKTPRLKTYEDLVRLHTASGTLMSEMLAAKETVGIIERIIIKYQLGVGENSEGTIYVPADLRVDKCHKLTLEDTLIISEPSYITSVECELAAEKADPQALMRGMRMIYDTLYDKGGLRTTIRFGRYSLAEDPKAYLKEDLQSINKSLTDPMFEELYVRMQKIGAQVFETYEKAPDSINRQVEPAKSGEMARLQQVNGRF